MAPWFSASAVAPLLASEWDLDRLGLPILAIAVQVGFAVGALTLAATAAADVIPARVLFVDRGRPRGGSEPRFRVPGRRCGLGIDLPVRHRAGARRCLPDRAQAAGRLVPSRARPGDRCPRRGAHRGIRPAVPAPGGRCKPGARLAHDGRRGERPGHRRRLDRVRRCLRRSVGRPGPTLQPRRRARRLPTALGPAGQPRLPRPHVGALRDVDVGPAVPRRELRRCRHHRSGGREPGGVRDRRLRRRRVRRRGPGRRSTRSDDGDDRRHGDLRDVRRRDRAAVRCPAAPHRRGGRGAGA